MNYDQMTISEMEEVYIKLGKRLRSAETQSSERTGRN